MVAAFLAVEREGLRPRSAGITVGASMRDSAAQPEVASKGWLAGRLGRGVGFIMRICENLDRVRENLEDSFPLAH